MIVYFADRQFNILGQASTNLPGGLRITEDKLTEQIDPGVNIFEFKVTYNDATRRELETAVEVGRFVLRGAETRGELEGYNALFQIIETEFNTDDHTMNVYAEDAGLELLNKVCPATKLKSKTLNQMMKAFVPSDWIIRLINTPKGAKSYEWDGENTATERINSVANLFNCEVFYTFNVQRLQITGKVINVIPKRGTQTATAQLRLNQDINKITTKVSIADMATALSVTGGTPDGKDNPINLKDYNYSYTDKSTGDIYKVDKSTGQMRNTSAMKRWSSAIDKDGLIVKSFDYDTTNKSTLAGQARAELQKMSKPTYEYEAEFVALPEGVRIGDRVNIIDEEGELYLEARLLTIETSIVTQTQSAVIGDYILKDSGINKSIMEVAKELSAQIKANSNPTIMRVGIVASIANENRTQAILTAHVYKNNELIADINTLGDGEMLQWYKGDAEIVGANGFTLEADLTQGTNYSCKLIQIVEESEDE